MNWISKLIHQLRQNRLLDKIEEIACIIEQQKAEAETVKQLLWEWQVPVGSKMQLVEQLVDLRGCIAWNELSLKQEQRKLDNYRP